MVVGISLGWNCSPAMLGVEHGYRQRKEEGYTTCPFDEMITSYDGILQCLEEDFQDFCNPECLTLKQISNESQYCKGDSLIYNKKYKFLFNHESPGHGNLWKYQNWSGGINHYIDNNYKLFRERYTRRVQNFRNYLNSGEEIIFLVIPPREDNYKELREILSQQYPNLKYSIMSFPFGVSEEHYNAHINLLSS